MPGLTTASTFPVWIKDGSPIPDPLGHGERAVQFLRRLRHPNSTAPGRAFQLYDWQERIVRRIYGPRNPDGSRIVKTVMLLLPRGNRKTSLAAALALLHLFGPESRAAGQVLFAACDREQASIGFKEAANIIREDRRLLRAVTIRDAFNSKKQITFRKNGSTLTALPSRAECVAISRKVRGFIHTEQPRHGTAANSFLAARCWNWFVQPERGGAGRKSRPFFMARVAKV